MTQETDTYRLLIEDMTDAFSHLRIILDERENLVDCEFLDVNNAFESMTGLKRDNIIGKKATEVLPVFRDLITDLNDKYCKGAFTGESAKLENHFELLGCWYEVIVYSNKPGFIVTCFRNITERMKREAELQETLKLFNILIESSPNLISIFDKDGTYIEVSPALAKVIGLPPEKIKGKTFAELLPPEVEFEFRKTIVKLQEKQQVIPKTETMQIDGNNYIFQTWLFPLGAKGTDKELFGAISIDITQHNKAQAELKDAHQKLLTILDNMGIVVYVIDLETYEILYINNYGKKEWGNVVGMKCWQVLQEKQTGPCDFCTNENAGVYQWDKYISKTKKWYECRHNTALQWIDGRMVRLVTAIDITDWKQVERLKLTYENTDVIWKYDVQTKKMVFTKGWEKLLGYQPGEREYDYNWWINSIHPDNVPVFKTALKDYIERKNKYLEFEHQIKTKSGHWKWVWTRGICTEWDSQGKPLKFSGIHTDITQNKLLENNLREANEKLNTVIDSSPLAIICIDSEGFVTSWNKAAEKIFGWTKKEVLGKFNPIVPDNKREEFCDLIEGAIYKHKQVTGREVVHKKKDGTLVDISVSTAPLYDSKGLVTGLLAMLEDITFRKKMEEDLLKDSRLESIGFLAGGIAHDFNNFLAVILGNISMISKEIKQEHKFFKRLKNAEKAIQQAVKLTNQLQTFARGGAPVKKTASIEKLIREVTSFTLSGSNVHCNLSFPEDLNYVDIDEGQISQVVNNIIMNAVQAMPEGGTLIISAEDFIVEKGESSQSSSLKEGLYVKLMIQDNGKGIAEKNIEKIFDPFFSTKVEGSGMGLATAYSIVKRHGGCIDVESQVGFGTTFCIYLPASSQKTITYKNEDEILLNGVGRVLFMDDLASVRTMVGDMATVLGYEVSFAHNGQEAVQMYKQAIDNNETFDAVILDLTVPGSMGGKNAAKEILSIDKNANLIVSSGYSNNPLLANYNDYGFKGFISKPYKVENLSKVLKEVIKTK